jgi:hemoglobin/transferrin/lactoferrin receptor protein
MYKKTIVLLIGILPITSFSATNVKKLPDLIITTQPSTSSEDRIDNGRTTITPSSYYRTINSILASDPEINDQSTGPQQQSPIVHGFTGYDNITLIDGIRMNNSTWRSGPNQYSGTVDLYAIDHMDILYGQSNMLYGSDAFGAAMNLNTRSRTDYSNDGFNWNGRAIYRYGSAETSNIGRAEFEGNYGKRVGFLIGTSIKAYGNMVGGELTGTQSNTGYDERNVDAKIDWHLTEGSSLTFVHQRYNSDDAWRNHRTISANYANNIMGAANGTYLYDTLDQSRTLSYVKFKSTDFKWFDVFSSTVSYQEAAQTELYQQLPTTKNSAINQQFNVNTIGVNVQAKNDTKLGNFTYGSDFYHDSVGSSGLSTSYTGKISASAPPVADNSGYNTLGLYISDDIPFWNNRGLLSLTSRYNQVDVNVDGPIVNNSNKQIGTGLQTNWNAFTNGGRLTLGLDQNNTYKWFIGANQGWRAPTLVDLTGNSLTLSGILQQPSPTIGPEKFITYETGIGYTRKKVNAVVTVFHTSIRDAISKDSKIADNTGYGYTQGVSFKSEYQFIPQAKLFAGITWTEGYLTSYNKSMNSEYKDNTSKINPITGNIGIRYDVTPTISTEINARLVGAQNKLSSADITDTTRIPVGGSKAYSLYGIRAGWTPVKNLTLSGAIENLTNTDYRTLGSGINGYGRNFITSVDYRF